MKRKIMVLVCFLLCTMVACKQNFGFTLIQIDPQTFKQMMGYVISDGETTIVVDGGREEESDYLIKQIQKTGDNTVEAWFLTHYHNDHTGALRKYLSDVYQPIQIKNIYYNFPKEEWVKEYENYRYDDLVSINKVLKNEKNSHKIKKGQTIELEGISIKALRAIDYSITINAGNNTSIPYLVTINDTRLLFLGDLGYHAEESVIDNFGEDIKDIDYVQMSHHGQNGVDEYFYKYINPKYCLWPTTKNIYENKEGIFNTDITKSWLKKLDVKKNYPASKGLIKIKIN